MACDTNNQPPRDTDHQKYAADVGGDIFATKLDRLFSCVCFGKEKHLYGSGWGPGVELCLNCDHYKHKSSQFPSKLETVFVVKVIVEVVGLEG